MTREISEQAEWNALPVGTAARIQTLDILEDGTDKDLTVFVVRVEGDVRCDVGSYILAGGRHWSIAFDWGEGGVVADLSELLV